MNIPAHYNTVMPYLVIKNAQQFIEFTQAVFDATEVADMRSMRDEHTIMHSEVILGSSTIMFADATEQFPERPAGLFVYVDDADATYQKALDAGATSIMPPADMPYGRSSGVLDTHGNTWWITSVK